MTTLRQRRVEGISFLPSSLFHEKKECTKDDAYSSDTSTPSTSRRPRSWRRKQRKKDVVVAKEETKEARSFRTRFSLRSSRSRDSEHPTSKEKPVDALPSGTDGDTAGGDEDEEEYVVHFMGSFLFKVSPRSDKHQNLNSASEDDCCSNRSDELNEDGQNQNAQEEAKTVSWFAAQKNDHEEEVDTAKVANATTKEEKANDEAPAETITESSRGEKGIEAFSVAETTLDQPPAIANHEKEVHAEEPPRRAKMTVRSCLLVAVALFSISVLHCCQMTNVTDSLSSLYAALSDSKRQAYNGLCAPIRLGATTSSISEWGAASDSVFVAPWWAPMPFKKTAFSLFCADGDRLQTRMEVQGKKVRIFNVETDKMVWGSRHGVVQIEANRLIKGCKEIKAPWAV